MDMTLRELIAAIPKNHTRDIPEAVIGREGCSATYQVLPVARCITLTQEYSRSMASTGNSIAMRGGLPDEEGDMDDDAEIRVGMAAMGAMVPEMVKIGQKCLKESLYSLQLGSEDRMMRSEIDIKTLPPVLLSCLSKQAFDVVQGVVNAGEVGARRSKRTS